MNTLRNNQLLVLLLAISIFSAAFANQEERPKRTLQYEISKKHVIVPLSKEYPELTHVGQFHISLDIKPDRWFLMISETSMWKKMSEKQRQLISKLQKEYNKPEEWVLRGKVYSAGSPFYEGPELHTPPGTRTYHVYGVSEEDVRKMTEAVIEYLNSQTSKNLEAHRKKLKDNRNIITEAEKMTHKLKVELKQLTTQTNEKIEEYANVNYLINEEQTTYSAVHKHAKKAMEDLTHYMRLIDFELIGLEAKIDSINKIKTSGSITEQDTLIKLEQILVTTDIERVGAMARKEAYDGALKQTKELCDSLNNRTKIAFQEHEWQEKLNCAREQLPKLEKILEDPPVEMRPVKVYQDKVVIFSSIAE